jgi:hypothetical protein
MLQVFNEMQAMFAEIVPGPYLQQQLMLILAIKHLIGVKQC